MLGSNAISNTRFMGELTNIPEKYHAAIRFGVRFFECHFPKPVDYGAIFFGLFDIRVSEDIVPGQVRPYYNADVLAGKDAQVKFDTVSKSGLAKAFIHDDKYWHNRVVLADTEASYKIAALHTRDDGAIPGSIAQLDISCLQEVMTEENTIYKVCNKIGREMCFFWTEKEANQEIDEFPERRQRGWHIVKGTKRRKTQFIRDLINTYRYNPYGWTNCEEFRTQIVPQVNALVAERRRSVSMDGDLGVPNVQAMIQAAIANLSVKDLSEIIESKTNQQDPLPLESFSQKAAEDVSTEQPSSGPYIWAKSTLTRKTKDELIELTKSMGLSTVTKTMRITEIIDAILTAQGSPVSTVPKIDESEIEDEEELTIT